MKLNKKGFTLIELLAVIVVIGLVLGLSTYGIIKAVDNSKEKSRKITESSIIKAAETYSNESSSNEWIEKIDNKYFCVTIGELINKGLLERDKIFNKNSKLKESDFVIIEKNIITNVITKKELNGDVSNCTGETEKLEKPQLNEETEYTDTIEVPFTSSVEDGTIECLYGQSSGKMEYTLGPKNNKCIFEGLKQNQTYYARVCVKKNNSYACSSTNKYDTLKIKMPSFNLDGNLTINYNDEGIIPGKSIHYFKSNYEAQANSFVNKCEFNNDKFTCKTTSKTKKIEKDTWYKVVNKEIDLTYSKEGHILVEARTYDKTGNYNESKKEFNTYAINYNLNGGTGDFPSQIKVEGKDIVLSNKIPKKSGYKFLGWSDTSSGKVKYEKKAIYKEDKSITLYAVWEQESCKASISSSSLTCRPSVPYKTEVNFDINPTSSFNCDDTIEPVYYLYSNDCALKSSSGAFANCITDDVPYEQRNKVVINAYYYTNNDNVNSANKYTNDASHTINLKVIYYYQGKNYYAETSCTYKLT